METQVTHQQFSIPKPLNELARSVYALFVLIFVIQMLLVQLQDFVPPAIRTATTLCFIFSFFTVFAFGALFAKTAVAKEEDRNLYVSYLGLELLFNFALSIFFVLLLFWIAYLRGVLNSPFSALLTTAPVSLLFITLKTKTALPIPKNATRGMDVLGDCLCGLARFSRVVPMLLYILCAIVVDVLLSRFFTSYTTVLESRVIGLAEHSTLRENIWYTFLSYATFFGSVISTLITCYTSAKVTAR